MNEKWNVFLGLVLTILMLAGAWFLIRWLWTDVLQNLNVNVGASLVVGVLAMGSALLVKRIENKHAIEAQFRRKKAKLYLEFRQALDNLFDRPQDDFVGQLKRMRAKLLLWGGPNTVKGFDELFATLRSLGEFSTAKQLFDASCAMGKFYLSMRKDLGLSNWGLTAENLGLSIMRHPQLISRMAKENPDMPIDELDRLGEESENVA